jgi:hypothetical protein
MSTIEEFIEAFDILYCSKGQLDVKKFLILAFHPFLKC